MPTNALLKTNVSGTWDSSTGLSYSQIPTITGISHKDQLEVERVFTAPSGTILTQEDFRKIYVIPAANYTVDETNKKITAFSASLPSYTTVGGTIVAVPAITNGAVIAIRRKSITSESLVNWVDGTRLTASQLNLQTSQLISVVQEILDRMNYEFVTATDLDYNFGYKWSTRSWVEGRIGAISTTVKSYIDTADTNLQNQITSAVDMNTTQNGRLDAIESLNTSQTSSINTLNTRVSPSTSLTGTYSASNLSAAVNGLDTRTTSVESRVTSVESINTTQTSNISALQTKVGAGTVTGTIVANGSDIITAVNAIDDYVTNAVTTSTNTIFNGHAQGRIVYAGASGTKDSTANFTITPSGTSPTVLTLAGNLSQTGVLNLTGNTTSVLNLTGTFTVNADSATVPTFKGASTQKIIAFKNSSNTEVNAIDQYGNLTGRATATYGSSSPTNPIAGSIWYDSANTAFKIYDGSAWNQVSTTTLANYVGLSGNETVAGNKTFSGAMTLSSNLTVDTNTLVVDATNNNVGIATSTPAGTIGVGGDVVIGNQANTGTSGTMRLVSSAGLNYIQSAQCAAGSSTATLLVTPYGGGAEYMRVQSTGVGIGAIGSSAVSRLHVHEAAASTATDIRLTSAVTGATSSNGVSLRLDTSGNSSLWNYENTSLLFATNNSEKMRISSTGNLGIGTTSPQQKLVVSNAGSEGLEIVPGNVAGSTVLQTYNRSDSTYDTMDLRASDFKIRIGSAEKVTIDSSGNVGIGTTSPSNLLHTHLASAATARIQLTNSTTGSSIEDGLQLRVDAGGAAYLMQGEASSLLLGTNNTERMRIDSSGNVGIGLPNPATKLHVSGASATTESIYLANSSSTSFVQTIAAGSTGVPAAGVPANSVWIEGAPASSGNTYLSSYNNNLVFATGTSRLERMRITSSGALIHGGTATGNVGTISLVPVGSSPFVNKLVFGTDGTGYKFAIASQTLLLPPVNHLVIQDNGNIGINTDSPTTKLAVNGTTSISGITTLSSTQGSTNTTSGALQVGGGVGIAENLYVGGDINIASAKKLVSPTVETDVIQSTGTLQFRGDYDASGGTTADMTINSSGVVVFANPPLYGAVPLAYSETEVLAQAAAATTGFRFNTGYEQYDTTNFPQTRYIKQGRFITLSGAIKPNVNKTLSETEYQLLGLPAPVQMVAGLATGVVFSNAAYNHNTVMLKIDTNGRLRFTFQQTGQTSVVYPQMIANATWLTFNITYMTAS
jgi:hypothetical protein